MLDANHMVDNLKLNNIYLFIYKCHIFILNYICSRIYSVAILEQ